MSSKFRQFFAYGTVRGHRRMFGQKTALLATLRGDRIWISIVLLNPRIRVSTTKLLNSVYAMVTYEIGLEFQRAARARLWWPKYRVI